MPFIVYPNLPMAPGVPVIPRDPNGDGSGSTGDTSLLGGDGAAFPFDPNSPQWGYFDDGGGALIQADSVVMFEGKKEYAISNYPTEPAGSGGSDASTSGGSNTGGFQSFNKVERPAEITVRYTTGSDIATRTQMLQDARTALASLDLYTAAMPEGTFANINIVGIDTGERTSDHGANMLFIDVKGEEVRNTATENFSQTQDASSQDPVNGGSVQPTTPSGDQTAAASGGAT